MGKHFTNSSNSKRKQYKKTHLDETISRKGTSSNRFKEEPKYKKRKKHRLMINILVVIC